MTSLVTTETFLNGNDPFENVFSPTLQYGNLRNLQSHMQSGEENLINAESPILVTHLVSKTQDNGVLGQLKFK